MSFGMKPITRANHVVVMPVTTDGLAGFVAASRTLYASHYFRDGLEVKYVVPVPPERGAFYLLSVNRSHSESLLGLKGLLLGGKIRSSARSGSTATYSTSSVRPNARLHESERGQRRDGSSRCSHGRRRSRASVSRRDRTHPTCVPCTPSCAACHGEDCLVAAPARTGLVVPLPDFTDCGYHTREPDADWVAVAHEGGPARAFSPDAGVRRGLVEGDLSKILRHLRTFCRGARPWPPGELTSRAPASPKRPIPRTRRSSASGVTVASARQPIRSTSGGSARAARSSWRCPSRPLYRQRPVARRRRRPEFGFKRAAPQRRARPHCAAAEILLPTGDPRPASRRHPAHRTVRLDGPALSATRPSCSFRPASNAVRHRTAPGARRSGASRRAPRSCRTPRPRLVADGEVLAARELERGADTLGPRARSRSPSTHVSTILANVGVRVPLNHRTGRSPVILCTSVGLVRRRPVRWLVALRARARRGGGRWSAPCRRRAGAARRRGGGRAARSRREPFKCRRAAWPATTT